MMRTEAKNAAPWLDSGSDRRRFPALRGEENADMAVIGGGMVGVMTAWRLAERGARVVLLEKGRIASGSTGDTTALVTRVPDTSSANLRKKYGKEYVRQVLGAARGAQAYLRELIRKENVDCDYVPCASYDCAYAMDEPGLLEEWEAVREAEPQARRVDGRQAAAAGAPIRQAVCVGGEGRFDPRKFVFGLLGRADAKRLKVFENSEVVDVKAGEDVTIQTKSGGVVRARKVIIATGPPIPPFGLPGTLEHFITFAMVADYAQGAPFSDDIFWDTDEPYQYFRRLDGRRIILGGADARADGKRGAGGGHEKLKAFLNRRFPGKYEVTHAWSGSIFSSNDGLPYVTPHPRYPKNVLVATGFGGNGMVMGTMAGLILADLAGGRKNGQAKLFSIGRGKKRAQKGNGKSAQETSAGVKKIKPTSEKRWSMGKFVKVASVKEVAEGKPFCAKANGNEIALFLVKGKYYAVENKCSHAGGPLCGGALDGGTVTCPWHGSKFDVASGQVLGGPAETAQKTFQVRVRGSDIEVMA